MSANLYWRPVPKTAHGLPDALKYILQDSQGLEAEMQVFTRASICYLRGLADAKIDGAQELINAIEKHEEVEVWLEY
jgi:hypothetical protein